MLAAVHSFLSEYVIGAKCHMDSTMGNGYQLWLGGQRANPNDTLSAFLWRLLKPSDGGSSPAAYVDWRYVNGLYTDWCYSRLNPLLLVMASPLVWVNGNCIAINEYPGYQWVDHPCSWAKCFVCQIDL